MLQAQWQCSINGVQVDDDDDAHSDDEEDEYEAGTRTVKASDTAAVPDAEASLGANDMREGNNNDVVGDSRQLSGPLAMSPKNKLQEAFKRNKTVRLSILNKGKSCLQANGKKRQSSMQTVLCAATFH